MKDYSKSQIPRLFSIMGEKNITAAQLCKTIGISSGNFSDWRSGKCKPTKAVLFALAQQLGVTPEYLLGETDNREKAEEKTPSKILEDEPMSEKEKQMWEILKNVPEDQMPKLIKLVEAALAIQLDEYKNGGQKE